MKRQTILLCLALPGLLFAPGLFIAIGDPNTARVGIGMMCGVMLGLPVIVTLWVLYTQEYWANHDRSRAARNEGPFTVTRVPSRAPRLKS